MLSKVVISVVSVLLVVGVAIGVVAVVNHNNKEASMSPQMKAVRSICEPAADQPACVKSLENVKSTDPNELIKQLVVSTQEAMKTASNFTDASLQKISDDPKGQMKAGLEYCKRVFDYALMDLKSFVDTVGGGGIETLSEKRYYLKQWIVNTWVYQFDCLNDVMDDNLRKTMEDGVSEARKLTGNAMDVVNKLENVLESLGVKLNATSVNEVINGSAGRHLLGDSGLPTWVSGADRKLLAKAGRGGKGQNGAGAGAGARPTAVVAQDGSGQYKTVSAAVAACPDNSPTRCVVYIKAGIYKEQVIIPKSKINIFMYGDGAKKTIITFDRSVVNSPKTTTSLSATVQVESTGFMAKYIGFKNTAGPTGHQAVALRINGDHAVVFNCRMDAFQDTLYVDSGHQFYRNCVVSGTVDFIFGASNAMIQNSLIIARRGAKGQFNTITADGTEKASQGTGIVIQNCIIAPDKRLAAAKFEVESYLGRPWKAASTTMIMQSEIGDFIRPEGWSIWNKKEPNTEQCIYREYANRGPGSNTNLRVKWRGYKVVTNAVEALPFTLGKFVLTPFNWINDARIPVKLGL